jgi:signal transduction histidine kinase/CheY-like chemotaxis protein
MSAAVLSAPPGLGAFGSARPAILVVDDNRANLVAFRATLEPLDHVVVTATSGEEALRHLLQRDFALILLDVQMPEMNGFELAELIKSHVRLAGVPIIFVTAISREAAHVFNGYRHGAVDYLLKPFDPEMLRAKVRVFVELYRTQHTIRAQAQMLHEHEVREIERGNEERFRELTESMPLPVWGVEPSGDVHACNRAWAEYSGLTAAQTGAMVGSPWMYAQDAPRARSTWAEGVRSGAAFDLECRLLRQRDESFRWHLLRAVPERGVRAREGFWIVAGTDIDAQKTAEEERGRLFEREQRAREEAEATNRMKDEFLATVSHELRTPLNAILGWARIVRTGTLDPASLAHAMGTIERNAQVQARLINDILDTSRIVSGKLHLQVGEVDLEAIVGDAIDAVRPAADAKSIELAWASAHEGAPLFGDASRLQQVVWNLLSNAVKFTPKGGRVEVRVDRSDDSARVIVEDTGRGIGPAFLPYVFDRFRQEDATISREHEGLGLGLSIVRNLVQLHGGHVSVESAGLGQGAKFTVCLPTDGSAARRSADRDASVLRWSSPPERPPREPRRLDGTTVLFVDDQFEARELVSLLLSRYGASVVAVETAEQAMGALGSAIPHVLISDIGLPVEDGYALIRRVRALEPSAGGNVPAIALTAYARPEDQRRAKHEGFQVHLAKPVEPDELVDLVANLVRAPERRPEVRDQETRSSEEASSVSA